MKNLKVIISTLGLIILLIVIYRCTKFDSEITTSDINTELEKISELKATELTHRKNKYDKEGQKIALAVAMAVNDVDFRTQIKEEALKMNDGDFEILYKEIAEHSKKNSSKKFKAFLADKSEKTEKLKLDKSEYNFGKFNQTFLDSFEKEFPKLIIAVRGPIENWDVDNLIPPVVFLPSNYKESDKSIKAFTNEGKVTKLDLTKKFEQPVIVVMLSERHDDNGNLKQEYTRNAPIFNSYIQDSIVPVTGIVSNFTSMAAVEEPASCTTPTTPAPFSATTVQAGIQLNWNTSTSYPLEYVRYEIYRSTGGSYSYWANASGYESSWLDCYNMNANTQYFYRLRAVYQSQTGNCVSSWVYANATAGSSPSPLQNFSVQHWDANRMKATWTINTAEFVTGIKIERLIQGVNSDYQVIANLPPDAVSYLDEEAQYYPGYLIEYRARAYNNFNNSNSNAVRDFDYMGKRNNGDPVYIYQITVRDISVVEGSLLGAPEFRVTVGTLSTLQGGNQIFMNQEELAFPSRTNTITFNRFICNWYNTFFQKVLSFQIYEDDNGWAFDNSISVGIQAPVKITETAKIDISTKSTFTFNIQDEDEDCGTRYYFYWQDPYNYTMQFSKGVTLWLRNRNY